MPSLEAVLSETRKKVTPSPAEQEEARQAVAAVEAAARKVHLSFTLAGSYLRNTWMPHKKEFDLFLLFPESLPREKLEKNGLAAGKKIVRLLKGKSVVAYAEHPYVRAEFRGYKVDIVPCYAVKSAEQIKSAVDRTPFHNRWLQKNLPVSLSSDVRLLKQLLKNNSLYGSDNRTLGFSGYLCELLVSFYGSFKKTVEAAAGWKAGEMIDHELHYEGSAAGVRQQFRHPLIIIDPVDRNRNVAAVLSEGNFLKFSRLCQQFLKAPSEKLFFEAPQPDIKKLRKVVSSEMFVTLCFPRPAELDDTLWPQLRKAGGRLTGLLEQTGFHVLGICVWADNLEPGARPKGQRCYIVLRLKEGKLPARKKVRGPPAGDEENVEKFRAKYRKQAFAQNGRWWAEIPRKEREAVPVIRTFLKQKGLKEKGVPSSLVRPIKKAVPINGKMLFSTLTKDREFAVAVQEWLEG